MSIGSFRRGKRSWDGCFVQFIPTLHNPTLSSHRFSSQRIEARAYFWSNADVFAWDPERNLQFVRIAERNKREKNCAIDFWKVCRRVDLVLRGFGEAERVLKPAGVLARLGKGRAHRLVLLQVNELRRWWNGASFTEFQH